MVFTSWSIEEFRSIHFQQWNLVMCNPFMNLLAIFSIGSEPGDTDLLARIRVN
jgi:hypothetical protein